MQSEGQNNSPSGKGLNTTHKILIAGFVILAVTVSVAAFAIYRSSQKVVFPTVTPRAEALGDTYVIDESNFEEIQKEMEESARDMFEVKMSTEWSFPDPAKPSANAYVANVETNNRPFFIEVMLADSGEVVLKSTVLPVGNVFKEITLDKQDLDAGSYNAICDYNLLNEDGEIHSTVSFSIKINVG